MSGMNRLSVCLSVCLCMWVGLELGKVLPLVAERPVSPLSDFECEFPPLGLVLVAMSQVDQILTVSAVGRQDVRPPDGRQSGRLKVIQTPIAFAVEVQPLQPGARHAHHTLAILLDAATQRVHRRPRQPKQRPTVRRQHQSAGEPVSPVLKPQSVDPLEGARPPYEPAELGCRHGVLDAPAVMELDDERPLLSADRGVALELALKLVEAPEAEEPVWPVGLEVRDRWVV
mmetsp:Transcript_24588/g.60789  ORF Transcript_24588/g.60789 Transcript_24588/m.60789 type:complete len:229 (-) Transcript_24588:863-1549(-)